MRVLRLLIVASLAPGAFSQVRLSESTGVNLFKNNCTTCHGATPVEHAPTEATIKTMPPERIYDAITNGSMKTNAAALSDVEKRLLAEYMGGRRLDKEDVGDVKNMPNACASHPAVKDMNAPAWNGWGDLSNTRFQPAKAAGLTAGKVSRLKLKWAFGFPGATALYGQTVVDGRVFVSSNAGYVYSLDAETGCVHWSFHAPAVVRSGITIGPMKAGSARLGAFFGDIRGNAYGLDATNGEILWKTATDPSQPLARVTGNPRLHDGRLYVPLASLEEDESRSAKHICCTFRGAVVALDASTGKQIWKSYTITETPKLIKTNSAGVAYMGPSGAGVWTSPIVDVKRRALYFGTGNSFSEPATTADSIMAMNMDTGKILWWKQALADDVWHGGCMQTVPGRPLPPRPAGAPGNQPPYPPENCVSKTGPDWDYSASPSLATMADGRTVIIASPKQAVVRALDPDKNGATMWEQDIARGIGGGAGETVFGGAVDDRNAQEFKTANGVTAKGGSIGAGGPVIANGMVFVGSGYVGFQNGVPGNVLLAFAPAF